MKAFKKSCDFCATHFVPNSNRQKYCSVDCRNKYARQRQHHNSEEIRERRKIYRENNKEKISQQKRHYYEANKEKIQKYKKKWYNKNKHVILQRQKEYNRNNPQKVREACARYYMRNEKKIKEYSREYHAQNREKMKKSSRARQEQVYDQCITAPSDDSLLHRVFTYLNQNPLASKTSLSAAFKEHDSSTVKQYYNSWIDITYKKYIGEDEA